MCLQLSFCLIIYSIKFDKYSWKVVIAILKLKCFYLNIGHEYSLLNKLRRISTVWIRSFRDIKTKTIVSDQVKADVD